MHMNHARDISDALGGIPSLAEICGVQYRLAYGYISRNSIPAVHDTKIVDALSLAGSPITLRDIAEWRARSFTDDSEYHSDKAKTVNEKLTCGGQVANTRASA